MHRDVLDTTLNYSAHVKFVSKWLDKLEAESKPQGAAAPRPTEPGLITEPALATMPNPATEPPIAGTAPAFNIPGQTGPASPDAPPTAAQDNADREKLLKVAQA